MRPLGEVATNSVPSGASATACTSSSVVSKNVVSLPAASTLKTLPSFPLPTYSDPSGAAAIDQRNGAVVSANSSVAGPSTRRPCPSIERLSTSPRRNSVSVAVCQNTGFEAMSALDAATIRQTARSARDLCANTMTQLSEKKREGLVRVEVNRERAGAHDGVFRG